MKLSDQFGPGKDDDDDDDEDDEEEEDEDEEEDDDEEDFATCQTCENAFDLNASMRKFMSRGRMTTETFRCPNCLAEAEAERRDKKAKKAKT